MSERLTHHWFLFDIETRNKWISFRNRPLLCANKTRSYIGCYTSH